MDAMMDWTDESTKEKPESFKTRRILLSGEEKGVSGDRPRKKLETVKGKGSCTHDCKALRFSNETCLVSAISSSKTCTHASGCDEKCSP